MKKLVAIFILLIPIYTFGQIYPNVLDFKGDIKQLTEKKYGREFKLFGLFKKSYYPSLPSGWKCTYQFDENRRLNKRTTVFKGKIVSESWYQYKEIDNQRIEREIVGGNSIEGQENYLEYEYFLEGDGRVEQVNSWTFDAKACTRNLVQVEKEVEYQQGRLVSFVRQNLNDTGEAGSSEKCSVFYNSAGQIIRIESQDTSTGLSNSFNYFYNDKGFLDHYSIEYLVGLSEYGKKDESQAIYLKTDHQGNWTEMYLNSGTKKLLLAKRTIRYW